MRGCSDVTEPSTSCPLAVGESWEREGLGGGGGREREGRGREGREGEGREREGEKRGGKRRGGEGRAEDADAKKQGGKKQTDTNSQSKL